MRNPITTRSWFAAAWFLSFALLAEDATTANEYWVSTIADIPCETEYDGSGDVDSLPTTHCWGGKRKETRREQFPH